MGLSNVRSDASTKADRKFEKKVQFYSKVREAVASLSAKRSIEKKSKSARKRQKKLKAYDLSALTDLLPDLKDQKEHAATLKSEINCKSRQKLVLKESKQLMTVISNPVFQSDPFAAIHQHLQSTQPPPETKPGKKSSDDFKKKKKKKARSASGVASMEM